MSEARKAPTIASAINEYLDVVKLARSQNTALTYAKALKEFKKVLFRAKIDPETSPANLLTEDQISRFVMHLKSFAPATEQLYVRAIARFYKYLAAERLAEINLPRMDLLIEQRTRKPGICFPQFPTNEIESVLDFVSDTASLATESEVERLRAMRDRAF